MPSSPPGVAWVVPLLLAASLSEAQGQGGDPEVRAWYDRVDEVRRQGFKAAKQEYEGTVLQPWKSKAGWEGAEEYRAVAEEICSQADIGGATVGVPDEAAVCVKRAKSIAKDLAKFRRSEFTRRDIIRLIKQFDKQRGSYGLWVRVELGVVVDYKILGTLQWVDSVVIHALCFLAFCQKMGVFGGLTFEYIATIRDTCEDDPLVLHKNMGPNDYFQFMPVLSYSRNHLCPHHVMVPVTPWIHLYQQTNWDQLASWERLQPTAVFRGWYNHEKRLQLAVLSSMGLVDADVQLTCYDLDNAVSRCNEHFDSLSATRGALPIAASKEEVCSRDSIARQIEAGRAKSTDPQTKRFYTAKSIPKQPGDAVCGGPADKSFDQSVYKYLLNIDGTGGLERFAYFFQSPGVVVEVGSDFEQFYSGDIEPFVHFAQVPKKAELMYTSLNATLGWLNDHDDIARDISMRAARYHKHLDTRAKARYFQLFAAMYATRWREIDLSIDNPHGKPTYKGESSDASSSADASASGSDEQHRRTTKKFKRKPKSTLIIKGDAGDAGPLTCDTLQSHLDRREFKLYGFWKEKACGELSGMRSLNEREVTLGGLRGDDDTKEIKKKGPYTSDVVEEVSPSPVRRAAPGFRKRSMRRGGGSGFATGLFGDPATRDELKAADKRLQRIAQSADALEKVSYADKFARLVSSEESWGAAGGGKAPQGQGGGAGGVGAPRMSYETALKHKKQAIDMELARVEQRIAARQREMRMQGAMDVHPNAHGVTSGKVYVHPLLEWAKRLCVAGLAYGLFYLPRARLVMLTAFSLFVLLLTEATSSPRTAEAGF